MTVRLVFGRSALLAVVGLGFVHGVLAPPARAEQAGAALAWHDCHYENQTDRVLRCGRLAIPGPAPASLPVVVVQHERGGPSNSALLFIQGGPGRGSGLGRSRLYWESWAETTGLVRDLVVYDQRGTGLSDTRPGCPEMQEIGREALAHGWYSQQSADLRRKAMAACHTRLVAEGHDLEQYTTLRNAEDIIALMDALPYESWTLFGSSYGSLLALQVLRKRPERLHSVILEGVQPPDVQWQWEQRFILENGMAIIAAACSSSTMDNPFCVRATDEVSDILMAALDTLLERPLWITVDGRPDELPYNVRVGAYELLMALKSELTYPDGANRARDVLMELSWGREAGLEIMLRYWAYDKIGGASPVYRSVICDGYQGWPAEDMEESRAAPGPYEKFMPRGTYANPCDYWNESRATSAMRRPVVSDIPVLLLSGEYDPLTPAHWADRVAATLERSHHVVIPRGGHSALGANPCADSIMRAFLSNPTAVPDQECLDDGMPGVRAPQ